MISHFLMKILLVFSLCLVFFFFFSIQSGDRDSVVEAEIPTLLTELNNCAQFWGVLPLLYSQNQSSGFWFSFQRREKPTLFFMLCFRNIWNLRFQV